MKSAALRTRHLSAVLPWAFACRRLLVHVRRRRLHRHTGGRPASGRAWPHRQALLSTLAGDKRRSNNGIRSFTFTPADGVPPAVAPFAHATAAGPTLYVTGQMPTDVTGAVVGDYVAIQTDQVLRNLMRVTDLCGGGWATSSPSALTFSIGTTTAPSTPPTRRGFPTGCRRAPVSESPAWRSGALVEIDWVCWRSDGWGTTIGS